MADGTVGRQTVGATMDYEIIYTLFHATMDASKILGIDADYREQLDAALSAFPISRSASTGSCRSGARITTKTSPEWSRLPFVRAYFPPMKLRCEALRNWPSRTHLA